MKAEDIKRFKKMLFEGAVRFSFKKNDGTIRHAKGTMAKDLMPKSDNPVVKRFKAYNIEWKDDENAPRRKTYVVGVTQKEIDEFGENAMDKAVKAALVHRFGVTPEKFDYSPVDEEKHGTMPPGHTLFFDLERGGMRSLADSALIEFEAAEA